VGFIGTVAPHKGVHVLVDAFQAIAHPEASLDIHGSLSADPAYARRVRDAASSDPRIRWHGAFPEGGQAQVHEALDVLVVPSLWWENSPITALEALADGLAVVASRTGGVPEVLDEGRLGLLVPPGDATALRVALEDVMAGRKLSEVLPPLPLKTVAEGARELEALYTSLVAGGPAS
jgi:glycosyltransferase involved in cell wall biosynthesis